MSVKKFLLLSQIFLCYCALGQVNEFPHYSGPGSRAIWDIASYPDSIKKISAHLQKYPKDTSAIYFRGWLSLTLGDAKSAILDFSRVLELSRTRIRTEHSEVYIQFGEALNLLGNFKQAIKYFDSANDLSVEEKTAILTGKSVALESLGEFDKALILLNRLIEICPEYCFFKTKRGDFFFRRANYEAALADYESDMEFIRRNSIYSSTGSTIKQLLLKRAVAKREIGQYQSAIDDLTEVLQVDSLNQLVLTERAMNYEKSKQYGQAMQDYNKVIKINRNNDDAFFSRGALKYDLGDKMGAKSDFDNAIALNSADPLYYLYRSRVQKESGKINQALSDINNAIKLDKNDGFSYYYRGGIRMKLGDLKGACSDWSKAGELGYMEAYEDIKEHCK